ncbi:MAG: recombination regulator RecX [Candidatus Paralactobacillus gallistercoris]|uniref:Regulatory protein RecX n=1 Tax=Candidatus Paralactobacillus gallistercoris TaxID=2838724 RepID=A0A948TIZ8_9LACO|nr:recombination regulator RecX [Candidatus Paralactobacillus gallistercoris]
MAIITKITAQKRKGRYNIFLDNQYAFAVGENILIRYGLFKGQEVDAQLQKQLQQAEQQDKAYNLALNYLSRQLRTVYEVMTYLHQHDVTHDVACAVVKRLCEQHYLNDQNYADSFVRTMYHTSDKGPYIIQRKLKQKHVADAVIAQALLQFDESRQLLNATTSVNKLAQHYRHDAFKTQQRKIYQALINKGYSSDIVKQAIAQADLQVDAEQQQQLLIQTGTKLLRRYQALDPKTRHQKILRALYQKGFSFDDAQAFLATYDHEN